MTHRWWQPRPLASVREAYRVDVSPVLWLFIIVAGIGRGISMVVSARNEVKLRAVGAIEYNVATTRLLLTAIVTYVIACLVEGATSASQVDAISGLGIALVLGSLVALYFLNRAMGGYWTAKVLVAPTHRRVRSAIYDRVRHPIYLFVLVPEWLGMGLAMHAWLVMLVGLPILFVLLALRIWQEETVLHAKFPEYGGLLIR